MSRVIDERLFEQPGFETLYDAWSDVFNIPEFSNNAAGALIRIMQARQQVEIEQAGMQPSAINSIERMACRAAREVPIRIEETVYEC